MRTKVNKICLVLSLALLPVAAGCAATDVLPIPGVINPAAPDTPITDGKPQMVLPDGLSLYLDPSGNPFPDPESQRLQARLLAGVGGDLRKYFTLTKEAYDPDEIFDDYA